MADQVPLPLGILRGEGHWSDQSASGRYSVEFSITQAADGSRLLAAHRVFSQPDGAPGTVEDSVTTFHFTFACFFRVTVEYPDKTCRGAGYAYGNQAHYGFDVDADTRVEYTWSIDPAGQLEGMGSSTNRGNFTAWSESLR